MKQPITVLLIEDNEDDFYLQKEVLESSDEMDVTILHETPLSALVVAQSHDLDVAIVDLSLPDSFGLDTYIAFNDEHPMVPTVIMAGHKDKETTFMAI